MQDFFITKLESISIILTVTFSILFFLFNEIGPKEISPRKIALALSSMTIILLSISPWHVLFGRTNFECNVALFFFLTGILFFFKGLRRPLFLVISAIFLAIAIPAYHAQRLVTPAIGLVLFLRHKKVLLSKIHKKYLIISIVVALALLIPTFLVVTTPGFLARAGLNIFNYERSNPAGFVEGYGGLLGFLLNNKILLSIQEFLSLYVSYFSPRNMFILGDYGPRSSFPELSTFFLWQFPFYLFGLYRLLKDKNLGELKFFTLSFLLISPLPAALTRDPYSTIRALQMVVPQLILISYGIICFYNLIKNRLVMVLSILIFIGLIGYSLLRLYSSVIVLNEYYRAPYWNYGWREVVESLERLDEKLPVVVDIARSEPYSQILFYLKFDPVTYQKENFEVGPNEYYTNMKRLDERKIGRITTKHINWEQDLKVEQYLVGDELAISTDQIKNHNLVLIQEVYYPDGSVAFQIVKTGRPK